MSSLRLFAIGDIILGPDAEKLLSGIAPTLTTGDLVVGHLEVPYTKRNLHAVQLSRVPEVLSALNYAGIDVVTLAGNHIFDYGAEGIEDTITWLKSNGIHYTGAGMNLEEAKKPAIIDRGGLRIGVLNYNCVGPSSTWAGCNKPGCAYIKVITHYELDYACPGGPPTIYTWAEPTTLKSMQVDIYNLRGQCDIVIVSFHKGLVHTPVRLADYEQQVAYAAIDAGADLILSHHAHILKGIEIYKGKPIFHGLCNGAVYLPSKTFDSGRLAMDWGKRRREIFQFEPDPDYPTYPFHPEAKYTIIATCRIENKMISQVSFLPVIVNKDGQPQIFGQDAQGQLVYDYMNKITQEAGLNARFAWNENEVVVFE